MNRATDFLRRTLSVMLALTPLLAGADLCTIGAVTGRADLACAMDSGAPACRVASAPAPKCSHCAPAAPVKQAPHRQGPTCCDLRPEAAGTTTQPVLDLPLPVSHQAAAFVAVTPVLVASPFVDVADDDRAPPGATPLLRSPRAPPLG